MRRIVLFLLVSAGFLVAGCGVVPSLDEATEQAEETKHAVQTILVDEATQEALETSQAAPAGTAEAGTAQALETDANLDENAPAPVTFQAGDCTITFLGDFEAFFGEKLTLRFKVDCGGAPGQGTFFATLGDPPSDSKATHGSGELDAAGEITVELDVNWPSGQTVLYCSYGGKVYPVDFIFPVH